MALVIGSIYWMAVGVPRATSLLMAGDATHKVTYSVAWHLILLGVLATLSVCSNRHNRTQTVFQVGQRPIPYRQKSYSKTIFQPIVGDR